MFVHPGKKLLFMGSELAAWREWDDDDGLPWAWADDAPHAGVRALVRDLNRLYREQTALHQVDFQPTGFSWIDCDDAAHSVISLIRRARAREATKCSPSSTSRRWCARAIGWACPSRAAIAS